MNTRLYTKQIIICYVDLLEAKYFFYRLAISMFVKKHIMKNEGIYFHS